MVGWEDGAAESPWYLRQPLSRHCPAASTGGADVYGLQCEGRPYHLLTACHCQEPSQALPPAPSAVSLPPLPHPAPPRPPPCALPKRQLWPLGQSSGVSEAALACHLTLAKIRRPRAPSRPPAAAPSLYTTMAIHSAGAISILSQTPVSWLSQGL